MGEKDNVPSNTTGAVSMATQARAGAAPLPQKQESTREKQPTSGAEPEYVEMPIAQPDIKSEAPEPPHDVAGWIALAAQPWILKDPAGYLYWDTKEALYSWIDTEGQEHSGQKRPPNAQVKKSWSKSDDDDD
jgi:hypothetical protein